MKTHLDYSWREVKIVQSIIKFFKKPISSIIFSVLFGFLVAMIILSVSGYNPFEAFYYMFSGIFARPKSIANVIIKATPIILTGVSVAFAFKTGLFNIGAEGQYIVGTIAAVLVGTQLNLPAFIQIPVIILCAMIAGGLLGAITGYLKAKFGIHEVITSIMFNWISLYLSNFVCNLEFIHKPNTTGTYPINESGLIVLLNNWKTSKEGIAKIKDNEFLVDVLLKTDLNFGILIAIAVAILVSFMLYKTTKGFEFRSVGFNSTASMFSGINVKRNIVESMLVAGAISGLAGAVTIMGMAPHAISTISVFENNGFNGLSVALIAGSSPIGCIFSGLLFSGLIFGGQSIQSELGAPSEIINIMIGTIVFFVSLSSVFPRLVSMLEKRQRRNDK